MNSRSPWSRKRKTQFICGALVLLAVLGACMFLRIWRPRDVVAYVGMAKECHPVWQQFAFRRFGAGDSASDLLQRYPPSRSEEFGRYAVYRYHEGGPNVVSLTGLSVITRDGKLLSAEAGSCTWQFCFFQTQDAEFDRQYEAFVKQSTRDSNMSDWEPRRSKLSGVPR